MSILNPLIGIWWFVPSKKKMEDKDTIYRRNMVVVGERSPPKPAKVVPSYASRRSLLLTLQVLDIDL